MFWKGSTAIDGLSGSAGPCGAASNADQAVAAARHGNQVALAAFVLVERLPERRHLDLEVVLLDDRPGQTRASSSSLVTTSPLAAASTDRMSSARLPSRTGTPSRDSSRRARSNRNRPNVTSSPLIARNQSSPRIQNISDSEPKTLSSSPTIVHIVAVASIVARGQVAPATFRQDATDHLRAIEEASSESRRGAGPDRSENIAELQFRRCAPSRR